MYYTYIIQSLSKKKFYTGSTQNLENRILRHNDSKEKSTKSGIPWVLVYKETFHTRSEAVFREKMIKKMKSSLYIKQLIGA